MFKEVVMFKDMFKPEAFPLKLKITPEGDRFKCVMSGGIEGKSLPVYGNTAAEALARVAVLLLDRQNELNVCSEIANLLGLEIVDEAEERAEETAAQ